MAGFSLWLVISICVVEPIVAGYRIEQGPCINESILVFPLGSSMCVVGVCWFVNKPAGLALVRAKVDLEQVPCLRYLAVNYKQLECQGNTWCAVAGY